MTLTIPHNSEQEEYVVDSDHNDMATLYLECVPSTGASWTVYEIIDTEIRSFSYRRMAEDNESEAIGGVSLMELNLFGKGHIKLAYGRPWEDKAWRYLVITIN